MAMVKAKKEALSGGIMSSAFCRSFSFLGVYVFISRSRVTNAPLLSQGETIKSTNIQKKVNNPPGLRFKEITPKSFLTVDGVVDETN